MFSMHKVVGLVVLIPTSPRSSKSESGRKSYHGFCKTCFHVWPGGAGCLTGLSGTDRLPRRCQPDVFQGALRAARSLARSDRAFRQAARKTPRSAPNGHISFGYKRGFFPNGFLGFLSTFFTTIVEPLELASSPFPPIILAYSWGI